MNDINVQNTPVSKTRSSNFELLRVFAMAIIVFSHSPFSHYYPELDGISHAAGQIGNTCFFLIAGYFFSLNSKTRLGKILKPLYLYFGIFLAILLVFFRNDFFNYFIPKIECAKNPLLPLASGDCLDIYKLSTRIYGSLWFIPTYLAIIVLAVVFKKYICGSPFWLKIIIAVSSYFVFLIMQQTHLSTGQNGIFQTLTDLWAWIPFFMVGLFIKEHLDFTFTNKIADTIIFTVLALVILVFVDLDNYYIKIVGILLFLIFKNLSFKNRVINKLGLSTYDIYIIHGIGLSNMLTNFLLSPFPKDLVYVFLFSLLQFFEALILSLIIRKFIKL